MPDAFALELDLDLAAPVPSAWRRIRRRRRAGRTGAASPPPPAIELVPVPPTGRASALDEDERGHDSGDAAATAATDEQDERVAARVRAVMAEFDLDERACESTSADDYRVPAVELTRVDRAKGNARSVG